MQRGFSFWSSLASACWRGWRFDLTCDTRWHPPATPHARACAGTVRVYITLRNVRMMQRIQALHQQTKNTKKNANTRVQSCRQPLRGRSDGRAYVHALDQYSGLLLHACVSYRHRGLASPLTRDSCNQLQCSTCGITLGGTHNCVYAGTGV